MNNKEVMSSEVIYISSDEEDNVVNLSSESSHIDENVSSNVSDTDSVQSDSDNDLVDVPGISNSTCFPSNGRGEASIDISLSDMPANKFPSCFASEEFPALKRSYVDQRESELIAKRRRTEDNHDKQLEEVSLRGRLNTLRKSMFKSLLVGGIKGKRNLCCIDFTSCHNTHSKQGIPRPILVQSRGVYSTMLEDDNLKQFSIRAILQRGVSHNQYLCRDVINLLCRYLFGSEKEMEAPVMSDLHLGISILYKQLRLHPPCKSGMRPIYLEMCQKWFSQLLNRIEDVLDKSCSPKSNEVKGEDTKHYPNCEEYFDFSNVVRKLALEKRERFLQRSKAEKILHLSILLKFFSSVFQSNALVWCIKHWSTNISAFRKDIAPILSEIVWDSRDFGSINQSVKKLFRLYCKTWEEYSLHEHFGLLISINATILHRSEMCSYPEMGLKTREYAWNLYVEIKGSSNLEANLSSLHPDWLKLLVASYFLDVEEPCNFYKVKERIVKFLYAKDKGCLVEQSFNVEMVCFQAITAMIGMMQLKSSKSEISDSTLEKIDEDSLWFRNTIEENFISNNLKMVNSILQLPCIKNRKWLFDGFEDCIRC